ncbi:hypothetical protein DFH08DRAFT_939411 [Mycena albidolilacea]|uniref:Uncharacterized protein n=1 Tax=Mycena albidolilacea TaxID=1033008 RepID=A0AAD7EL51_9AGAR|nr:hypothetical protein DFH08DRAFT_945628 [Mycena albidolilacea]KAJ7327916.1 hypothetical protein DFH08DRAFT_940706 [Mycena albidolilacea]KAJ7336412.1 hypothetical protein DFH08DRAFT_939411 [Mycena albidolilacea]
MPSLSQLAELPLDSSPLKPDSLPNSPIRRSPVRLDDPTTPSPTRTVAQTVQHKRPAEDMTQFATEMSRVHKLTKVDHDQLQTFAKYPQAEKLIFLAGSVLSLAHHQRLIAPSEALIVLPKKLQGKILDNASILILDSSIPAYRNEKIGPVKLLTDLVISHGVSWGFTDAMKGDRDQMKAVKDDIGGALTSRRNGVKHTILGSRGNDPAPGQTLRSDALNIVELTEALISQQKLLTLKIDVALCGRVALLRQVITEAPGNAYWTTVDTELANLRNKHPVAADLSRFIKRHVLDPDFKTYGSVDIPGLARASGSRPRRPQASLSAAASGSASTAAT